MRLLGLGCLFLGFILSGGASAERRALVIGIDAYREVPPLEKAVGDARAMAVTLQDLGFTVTESIDPDRRSLNQAIATFGATLSQGDTALVHFSGHGVEIDGENYLLPADAPKPVSGGESFVKAEAVAMSDLVAAIEDAGAGTRIFVIDACRDNPFEQVGVRSVGGTRGLARVEAPAGTFILYSAGYRQTALDGLGPDDPTPTSVYTRVLLRHLTRAGASLADVAQDVRQEVEELARTIGHEQRPAYYDELSTRVVLVAPETEEQPVISEEAGAPNNAIATDYALAERIGTAAAWDAFLARHGGNAENFYVQLAEAARLKLAALETDAPVQEPAAPLDCEGGLIASVGEAGIPAVSERCLRPGDTFKDCDECPEMVVIPAGTFTMGSPEDEVGRNANEGPQHSVTIPMLFAVGKFEVTRAEFAAFVMDSGHDAGSTCWTAEGGIWDERSSRSWRNPGFNQDDAHPVVCVGWEDANAYAAWRSRSTDKAYRLLSESEWEYVARAGTVTPFHFDDRESALCVYANFADVLQRPTACSDGVEDTAEVGQYRANAFGLHDMHGNVLEWVEDCPESYSNTPADGSAWTNATCEDRIIRGGSWLNDPKDLRSAFRVAGEGRAAGTGFRVARTLLR